MEKTRSDEHKGHEHTEHKGGVWRTLLGSNELFYGLMIFAFMIFAFNQLQLSSLKAASVAVSLAANTPISANTVISQAAVQQAPASQAASAARTAGTELLAAVEQKVVPRGVPAAYGSELGVSYDTPVASMQKLAALDDGKGMADPAMNARYVKLGSMIACEYCCGAQTLVDGSGNAACGCAHSYAMRGLLKYLIQKHSSMTDDQMLTEMGNWKILFFPQPMLSKALQFESAGKDLNIVDLTSNKYHGFTAPSSGLPGSASSGSSSAPSGASSGSPLNGVPAQVGGC